MPRTPSAARRISAQGRDSAAYRGARVRAYNITSEGQPGGGYWRDVGTLDSYWQANMDLIARHPEFDLYDDAWPIRSGTGHRPPAKICVSTEGTDGAL
jgi:glucose-1-phosphate adenylyltransferase